MATAQSRLLKDDAKPTIINRVTRDGGKYTYEFKIIQQPRIARACGQGAKSTTDRRPVDPPPVVQLQIFKGEGADRIDVSQQYPANFFVYASLEPKDDRTSVNIAKPLTGTPNTGGLYLERPAKAVFFIFGDLSVRHEGHFSLNFHLFELPFCQHDAVMDLMCDANGNDNLAKEPAAINRCQVLSNTFEVFSAKKFPGLAESTHLSRDLADQGCKVRIRRDVRVRKHNGKETMKLGASGKSDDEGEDSDTQDTCPETPVSARPATETGDRTNSTATSIHNMPSAEVYATEPRDQLGSSSQNESQSRMLPPERIPSRQILQEAFQPEPAQKSDPPYNLTTSYQTPAIPQHQPTQQPYHQNGEQSGQPRDQQTFHPTSHTYSSQHFSLPQPSPPAYNYGWTSQPAAYTSYAQQQPNIRRQSALSDTLPTLPLPQIQQSYQQQSQQQHQQQYQQQEQPHQYQHQQEPQQYQHQQNQYQQPHQQPQYQQNTHQYQSQDQQPQHQQPENQVQYPQQQTTNYQPQSSLHAPHTQYVPPSEAKVIVDPFYKSAYGYWNQAPPPPPQWASPAAQALAQSAPAFALLDPSGSGERIPTNAATYAMVQAWVPPCPPPQYVHGAPKTGKRTYSQSFDTTHINQPMQSGARPELESVAEGGSAGSAGSEEDTDVDYEDVEELRAMLELKRADGTRSTLSNTAAMRQRREIAGYGL